MTRPQQRILTAVRTLTERLGQPPTYEEIADECGLGSVATVHAHVHVLIRQGKLFSKPRVSRSLTLEPQGQVCVLSGLLRETLCPGCRSVVPPNSFHRCGGQVAETRAAA